MTIDQALDEWRTRRRRMGCVSAAQWLCHRVAGWHPLRLTQYTEFGAVFEHVVATDGVVVIDLAPYANRPRM